VTTKVDVINEALALLGQPEMSGPSDTSSWVRKLTKRYNPTVRRLLEIHPWNFASSRVALQVTATTPIGREYAYNKPADCLRICLVNNTGVSEDNEIPDYEDEGGTILTDMSPCYLFYISSTWATKEGAWPQAFAHAVSCELANVQTEAVTKNLAKGESADRRAAKALKKARAWDAAQKPFKRSPGGLWAGARRRGMRYRTDG
jgi:hypothetical protein